MKKILLLIIMAALSMGAFAQKGKSKKAKVPDNRPTVVSFVSASEEEFLLFFDGTKQNKNPQKKYQIKDAKLNTEYYVRVLLKKPNAATNMAYTTIKIDKMGEEWVVYYNTRRDCVELMSKADYEIMKAKLASKKAKPFNKQNLINKPQKAIQHDTSKTIKTFRIGPIKPVHQDTTMADTAKRK